MAKTGKAYHAGEHLCDMMDAVNDLNKIFHEKAWVDVFAWNDDGTVTISVDDPIGNTIYTEDMTAAQAFCTLRGMVYGIMIYQGKDI